MAQLKQTIISNDNIALKVQTAGNNPVEVFKVEASGTDGSIITSSAQHNKFTNNFLEGNNGQGLQLNSNELSYKTSGSTVYKVLLGTGESGVTFASSGQLGGSAISAKKLVSGDTVDSLAYTVGDNTHLIYFSGGIPMISTGSVGNSKKLIYLDNGELKATTEKIGSSTKPIYLDSGIFSESNANIGSSNQPMYLENGEFKATTYQLNATFNGLAGDGSAITASKSDHTHNISLATDSGTSNVSLAYNTKYKLTAGGKSIVFTTTPKQTVNTTNLTVYYSDGTSGTLTVATGIN